MKFGMVPPRWIGVLKSRLLNRLERLPNEGGIDPRYRFGLVPNANEFKCDPALTLKNPGCYQLDYWRLSLCL